MAITGRNRMNSRNRVQNSPMLPMKVKTSTNVGRK
jgi:hypothetical protein